MRPDHIDSMEIVVEIVRGIITSQKVRNQPKIAIIKLKYDRIPYTQRIRIQIHRQINGRSYLYITVCVNNTWVE